MGSPVVRCNGLEVRPKTKKMLLLLAMLSLEGRVSRERLACLFWADSADAKNSLRNALSGLRYQYGSVVQSNRSEVWLEAMTCDAKEILQGSLQVVLNSQGTLLEGIEIPEAPEVEDWLLETRRQVLAAAVRLLEHESIKQSEQAPMNHSEQAPMNHSEQAPTSQTVLEKWIQLEPLSEIAHQRLMRHLADLGERTRALEVFGRFRSRLQSELGVSPTPETLALADGLQLVSKPTGRVPSLPTLLLESRLVGRVPEFQRLVTAFHKSAQGQAQVAVVVGEPGIGKTRLAAEFLAWAGLRSAQTISARAFEGGGLAYQIIADSLRRVPALETVLSKVWLAELARLLPELLEFDLPPPVLEDALGRSRVFEAVAKLSQKLGHMVWLLDDLQWADAASLEVLNFVLRRAVQDGQPLLLVATLRTEALESVQPWLAGLPVAPEMLPLEALSKDETARLLSDIGVDSAILLEWLFAETGGQPLYIAETLRGLTETGALSQSQSGWDVKLLPQQQLAANVRSVIEARFARLPAQARLLLEAGAVLGQGFTFADALHMVQIPETQLLDALEACLRARVLLELPNIGFDVVRYAFSHDKLRETALLRLSAPRLQSLHRLALARGSGSAAQKAMHAFGARMWQAAVHHSFEAANSAAKTYAWQDALTHLERGRQILRQAPDQMPRDAGLGSEQLSKFFGLFSSLHVTLNLFDENIVLAHEVLELSRAIADRDLEAQSLMFLADTSEFAFAKPEEGMRLRQQANAIFFETQNAKGLFHLAVMGVDLRLPDAVDQLKALLPQAEALHDGSDVSLLATIASTTQAFGQWEAAIGYWNTTLARQNIHHDSDICAYRLENLAFCYTNLGQLEQAVQNGREALRIKRTIDDNKAFIGMAAVYLAYALLEFGATAEALELCEEAYAYRQSALPRMGAEFCFALATVRLEQGLWQSAICLLDEAKAIFATLPASGFEVLGASYQNYLESHLCAAYAGLGMWEKAACHAQTAFEVRQKYQDWRGIHAPKLHHWLEVAALQKIGKTTLARQIVDGLERFSDEPLEVNLALCRWQFGQRDLPTIPSSWRLRRSWLEANQIPSSQTEGGE